MAACKSKREGLCRHGNASQLAASKVVRTI